VVSLRSGKEMVGGSEDEDEDERCRSFMRCVRC
jgi:hypothetical protein